MKVLSAPSRRRLIVLLEDDGGWEPGSKYESQTAGALLRRGLVKLNGHGFVLTEKGRDAGENYRDGGDRRWSNQIDYARREFFLGAIPCVLADARDFDRLLPSPRAGSREFDEIMGELLPDWRHHKNEAVWGDVAWALGELGRRGEVLEVRGDCGWRWWRLIEDEEADHSPR